MKQLPYILILIASCKVTEKDITGTWQPGNQQSTRLILKEDKSFEFALLNPATDSLMFPSKTTMNFCTIGQWSLDNNKLVLTSYTGTTSVQPGIYDSITRFTSLSSFNFWNRYGDPVPIRYIVLQSKTKPHYGNSLFFFAQDFKETDTIRFYFDGYPPFFFPGTIPAAIGNNNHKVILTEPQRNDVFDELSFTAKKNLLSCSAGKLKFQKRK